MTESQIRVLLENGVKIPNPDALEIGPEVDPKRIAPGVTIHAGCKIYGEKTSIGPGCVLGYEAPATVENCQLGRGVKLKGGYFAGAVFLNGSNMGSGAHVRAGTILEEQANGAHTVGLKQTILLPFVTLGSLINFCDAMMGGGTSRKDHSEVGSSYIHFNFTPQQDKATASLIGDVARGVMLDQKPIFLGGQGGLVGPVRINYGCVIGAGTVARKDMLEENKLQTAPTPDIHTDTGPSIYKKITRKVTNNLHYVGNLLALEAWYKVVRKSFISDDFSKACYEGALGNLDAAIKERLKRLTAFGKKLPESIAYWEAEGNEIILKDQKRFMAQWPKMETQILELRQQAASGPEAEAVASVVVGDDYLKTVQGLSAEAKKQGSAWLNGVIQGVVTLWTDTPG